MKKSFLIPAIVLYVVRAAFSNNVPVGTVLFTTTDLVRRCWSEYDRSLLRARAIMQDVLPDPDCLDFSNPEAIVVLLDYFHTCYKIISISTYGKVQHLLFVALSDAFGGYLRAHVLPYTKKSYYAGTMQYSEAQKLFLLYDDIKSFLKTDGQGWPLPSKAALRTPHVKPLVITNGSAEDCNVLYIIEKEEKEHYMDRNEKHEHQTPKAEKNELKPNEKHRKGKRPKPSMRTKAPKATALRRVQRQLNGYNDTSRRRQNDLKNLSSPTEDVNENEDISSFGFRKTNRRSHVRSSKEDGFEGLREETHLKELRRNEAYREQARNEEACREEARKEEARKHEDLREEPVTEDPCGEELCKTEAHKEENYNEGLSIEDLFKEEDRKKEALKEEQREDPCRKGTPKEENSSTENLSLDYFIKEDPRKEYTSQEYSEEYSSTENPCKEHKLQEDSEKEYFSTENPRKEYSSTGNPRQEHFSTENPCKEYKFQEDPRKKCSAVSNSRTENPRKEYSSTENSSTEGIFEKVLSKEGPDEEVLKEETQKEAAGESNEEVLKEEVQTEAAGESNEEVLKEEAQKGVARKEETRKEDHKEEARKEGVPKKDTRKDRILNKKTSRTFLIRDKISKKKPPQQKPRKQQIPGVERQKSGHIKTVIVPLPILDDYNSPTSIALPFRKRPLRNLKAESSAFVLESYYTSVIKCFIAKGNTRRDIKDFNGQFHRWLTSRVLPLLGDEQWYPGFGGVLRVLETIKLFGADNTYKGGECHDYGFLFDEGAEFSVDSSFGCKGSYKARDVCNAEEITDPTRRFVVAFILILSLVVLLLLCCCLFCWQFFRRRTTSLEEQHDMVSNSQENQQDVNSCLEKRNLKSDDGKDQGASTCENKPQVNYGGEIWSFGDTHVPHRQQEVHYLTKHTRFPDSREPHLLHNVHTLWKKPSNLVNHYWTSDETKCYRTEMRTTTCNCTGSCNCTILTDSSLTTKAKTRKSSNVTFFEGDDDEVNPRQNTSTRSSTQYSTTESGSEDFSSSEYSVSSKSIKKHRNSTHYP